MKSSPPDQQFWKLPAAARMVHLSPARVRRYVRTGLIRPTRVEQGETLFGEGELARLRKIRRLSADLGLSLAGVEVVLHLLDELEALRAQLAAAQRSRT